ncbi:MAG: hypothetical protein HOP15_13305, partial [Planctomycetes bacterium]|nr:hypothetical protein [Planctomycetota bacterium]
LDPAGRVLLVTRGSNDRAPKLLELAGKVIERFDRELPAPALRLEAEDPLLAAKSKVEPEKPAAREPPLPEDPEDPEGAHPWKLAPPKPVEVTSAKPVVTTWGSQDQPLDTQTVVLFVLHDEDDFESLLGQLRERFPFLEVWTREAKALAGFAIGDPLTAAYLENPRGVEEWNADNELVSRVARLCLLRRFGALPNWLVQGYAWHMEFALMGAVYVFPWRDEFVWATEHSGWGKIVEERYAKTSLKPADFMGWRRGKYLEPEAKASWAACEYLLAKESGQLPLLLDRLRVFREEHGRIKDDPKSWRRDLDYEIPVADQHALFSELLGDGYLARASIFFRQELAH